MVDFPYTHKLEDGTVVATCVQCGYCCTQGVCAFGEWGEQRHCCIWLTDDNKCGHYHWIKVYGGSLARTNPGFGAGCCSGLNEQRLKRIIELESKKKGGETNGS